MRNGLTNRHTLYARGQTKFSKCLTESVHRGRAIPDRKPTLSGPARAIFFFEQRSMPAPSDTTAADRYRDPWPRWTSRLIGSAQRPRSWLCFFFTESNLGQQLGPVPSAWEQTRSAPGRAVALERRGALRSSDLCPWAIGAAYCFFFTVSDRI
jgi:hypothetical protein